MSIYYAVIEHRLKLSWRTLAGDQSRVVRALSIGFIVVACHLLGYFLYHNFAQLPADLVASEGPRVLGIGFMVVLIWMFFTALRQCADVMANQKELELFLTSPMSVQAIFAANFCAVIVHSAALFILALLPFANVALLFGDLKWLGLYGVISSLAVIASSLALVVCGLLFKYLGIAKGRTVVNLLMVAIAILSIFSLLMTGPLASGVIGVQWMKSMRTLASPGEVFGPQSAVWLFGQAALAQMPALISVLLGGAVIGSVALKTMAPLYYGAFISGSSQRTTPVAKAVIGWQRGLWMTFFVKEWRAISREPKLILDILFQLVIIVTPMLFIVLQISIGRSDAAVYLFPIVTIFVGCLAGVFSWISLSGEECPVLLQTTPLGFAQIKRLKLICVLLPLWLTLAVLGLIAIMAEPYAGAVMLICSMAATVHVGLTNAGLASQSSRLVLNKRGTHSDASARVIEFILIIGWGAITYGALFEWPIFYYGCAAVVASGLVSVKLKQSWLV